jgi:RNA polymerase sigma-70 factor (ECF subfamily)
MTGASQLEREALPQLGALRQFAYQLCRNEQYSRDLVQETMLKACRSFHQYREGTNCRAWLFQSCKNSYVNDYRRKQLEPIPVGVQESSAHLTEDSDELRRVRVLLHDCSDEQKHRDCMGDEVIEALHALPDVYQTVVILSDIEGHSYKAIASFTHVPVGTIRSRIHRGWRMLAERLAGYARSVGLNVVAKTASGEVTRVVCRRKDEPGSNREHSRPWAAADQRAWTPSQSKRCI